MVEHVRVHRAIAKVGLGRRLGFIVDRAGERRQTQMLSESDLEKFGQDEIAYFEAEIDRDTGRWRLGDRVFNLRPF